MCYHLGETPRYDIWDKGFQGISDHLFRFDPTYVWKDLTTQANVEEFFQYLFFSFERVIAAQLDPFTGKRIVLESTTTFEVVHSKLMDIFGSVSKFIWKHKFYLLGSTLVLGSLYWISGLFTSILGVTPESIDLGRSHHKVGRLQQQQLSKARPTINVFPQGGTNFVFNLESLPKIDTSIIGANSNTNDTITKVLNKYHFIVYLVEPKGEGKDPTCKRLGHALNLASTYFLVPFHFVYQVNMICNKVGYSGAQIVFTTATRSNKYVITAEDFVLNHYTDDVCSDNDLCVINVRVAHRNSIGMMSSILKASDLSVLKKNYSFPGTLVGTHMPSITSNNIIIRTSEVKCSLYKGLQVKSNWTQEDYIYALDETITYDTSTGAGDCGSMLVVDYTGFSNRCIAGIHVAGSGSAGYSTFICQEAITSVLRSVRDFIPIPFSSEGPNLYFEPIVAVPQGNISQIGNLKPSAQYYDVGISDIKKSKFHGRLLAPYDVVKTRPTRLKPFTQDDVVIDPRKIALSNYGKEPVCIPFKHLDMAITSYREIVLNSSTRSDTGKGVLTTFEALHDYEYLNPIASSTSAGFPMTGDAQCNLKKRYFDAIAGRGDVSREQALADIEKAESDVIEQLCMGIRLYWYYKDSLKDEKISFEKWLAGKTRLFSGVPFILLNLFRRYFGEFMSDFFSLNLKVGSAIGINPYSGQWDEMARSLMKFNSTDNEKSIAAGDYSKYDAHLQPSILQGVLDIILAWYGDSDVEANNIRSQLWAEIVNSRHVSNNEVFEWFSSMPSGNPMTAIINTMANNIIIRLCWIDVGLDILLFNTKVFFVSLGDDHVFSVSCEYREIFNEVTLTSAMKNVGFVYTSELKIISTIPFRDITQVEFLKRSFRFERQFNKWVAPIRFDSITEMLNWTKKGRLGDQIAVDNVVNALREISLHEPQFYSIWYPHLKRLLCECYPNLTPNGSIDSVRSAVLSQVLAIEDFHWS
jgi:hypothetical protein